MIQLFRSNDDKANEKFEMLQLLTKSKTSH